MEEDPRSPSARPGLSFRLKEVLRQCKAGPGDVAATSPMRQPDSILIDPSTGKALRWPDEASAGWNIAAAGSPGGLGTRGQDAAFKPGDSIQWGGPPGSSSLGGLVPALGTSAQPCGSVLLPNGGPAGPEEMEGMSVAGSARLASRRQAKDGTCCPSQRPEPFPRHAADGTVAPPRPARRVRVRPNQVVLFAPLARALTWAEMAACLKLLSSAMLQGDSRRALRLQHEIRVSSSPLGTGVQRLGYLLLRSLRLRDTLASLTTLTPAAMTERLARATPGRPEEAVQSLLVYQEASLLPSFPFVAALRRILDAMEGFTCVHVIVLGCSRLHLGRWRHLLHGLAARSSGPPSQLRLTFLCDDDAAASGAPWAGTRQLLSALQEELESEARRWGLGGFEFVAVDLLSHGLAALQGVQGKPQATGPNRLSPGIALTAPHPRPAAVHKLLAGEMSRPPPALLPGQKEAVVFSPSWASQDPLAEEEQGGSGFPRDVLGLAYPEEHQLVGAPDCFPWQEEDDGFSGGGPPFSPRLVIEEAAQSVPVAASLPKAQDEGGADVPSKWGLCVCSILSLDSTALNGNAGGRNNRASLLEWARGLQPDLLLVANKEGERGPIGQDKRFASCLEEAIPLFQYHDQMVQESKQAPVCPPLGRRKAREHVVQNGRIREKEHCVMSPQVLGQPATSLQAVKNLEHHMYHFEQAFLGDRCNRLIVPSSFHLVDRFGIKSWRHLLQGLGFHELSWSSSTQEFLQQCLHGHPSEMSLSLDKGLACIGWAGMPQVFVLSCSRSHS